MKTNAQGGEVMRRPVIDQYLMRRLHGLLARARRSAVTPSNKYDEYWIGIIDGICASIRELGGRVPSTHRNRGRKALGR